MKTTFIRKLGSGAYSNVWLTCRNTMFYATKCFDVYDLDILHNEVLCQNQASRYGLAPKIHHVEHICLRSYYKCFIYMEPLLGNFRTDSEILHSLELQNKMYSNLYKNVNKYIKCQEKRVSDMGIDILDFQTMLDIKDDEVVNGYVVDFGNAQLNDKCDVINKS